MGPRVVPRSKLERPLSSDLGLRDQEKQRGQARAGAEDNGREVGNHAGRVEQRDRVGDVGRQRMAPVLFYRWNVSFCRIITLQLKHWLSIAG